MFVVFFLIVTTILVGWHVYMWRRLVHNTKLPRPWARAALGVLVLLAIALPATMILGRSYQADALRPFYLVGFGWLGMAFLILVMLLTLDLVRAVAWIGKKVSRATHAMDPDRRLTLARASAAFVVLVSGSATAAGAVSALGRIPVERLRVSLRRLPKKMSGTILVQISDVHVGPTLRRDFVERVVAQVNELKPDVVAITGDLVDGSVEQLRDLVEPLGRIRARYGVFFATGNHEYYSGVDAWLEELKRLGIRVLRNERVSIGEGGASFDLAGVDDWSAARHGNGHKHDMDAAMRGIAEDREVVLLAHQPRSIWDAVRHGVGLQLSGHTHGGQIFPWMHFVRLQQPFVVGLHRVKNTMLYVNRGTGFWGPPVRVGAPPEITHIELVSAPLGEPGGERIADDENAPRDIPM